MKFKSMLAGLLALIMVAASPNAKAAQQKTITLSADNVISVNGVIDEDTVSTVIQKARELDAKLSSSLSEKLAVKLGKEKKHLILFMYTPGGDIQKGFELIDALKGLGRPVDTVTLFAASMGFQIVQSMGARYSLPSGVLMSHQAYGGMEGSFGPERSQLRSRYEFWLKRVNELDELTVSRTKGKQTLKSYQDAYKDEIWDTGAASVKDGYADEVVVAQCDSGLLGVETHTVSFMGIPIKYDTDKCPLNTAYMNIRVELSTTKGTKTVQAFLNEGGSFDPGCRYGTNKDALCALDPSLTLEKLNKIQSDFIGKRDYKNNIVPMKF